MPSCCCAYTTYDKMLPLPLSKVQKKKKNICPKNEACVEKLMFDFLINCDHLMIHFHRHIIKDGLFSFFNMNIFFLNQLFKCVPQKLKSPFKEFRIELITSIVFSVSLMKTK